MALEGDNGEVILQRDGSYIESCYVLSPEISCDETVIAALKSRRHNNVSVDRLKTEIEMERSIVTKLKKKIESEQGTVTRLETSLANQKTALDSKNKMIDEYKKEIESLQKQIMKR